MAMRTLRTVLIALSSAHVVFAIGGTTAPAAGEEPRFRITDLGVMSEEPTARSMALGINALGEVVGWSGPNDENPYAFIWLPEANYGELAPGPLYSLTKLDLGSDYISEAHDINDRGEIAGQLGRSIFSPTARFWRYDDGWSSLDLSDSGLDSRAFAVSNHDNPFVVGWHDATDQQQQEGYICDVNGAPLKFAYRAKITGDSVQRTDLNSDPPADMNTIAYDLDDWTEIPDVVGMMDDCGGAHFHCPEERRAAYWPEGGETFLDGLDPEDPDSTWRTEARGISQVGLTIEIAGVAWDWEYEEECYPHAAYWLGPDGTCIRLPDAPTIPPTTSTGQAICRHDDFVWIAGWEGQPDDLLNRCYAILWEKEDGGNWQPIVLDTAIPTCSDEVWRLYQAQDLNGDGWIVGVGWNETWSQVRAFLLTPVRSEEECPWDLDRDGDVDTADLLELLGSWGECPVGKICWTDFNTNCETDTADLLALQGHWGPCDGDGASQVPEEILAAWLAGGGEEALLSNNITAEQVGACLDKPTSAEAVAALYELLFN